MNICQQLQIKSYKMIEKYCFKTKQEQIIEDFQKKKIAKAIQKELFFIYKINDISNVI